MASIYTFKFTDTSKPEFIVQPYTSNGILSPADGNLLPNANSANTTLKLYGKGMQDYGEGIEQNLIYILESFANSIRPLKSIEGQIWYKNSTSGSPLTDPELFIRNDSPDDLAGWDAIILATGSSAMTGELILSGVPTNPNAAIPLSYITSHETNFGLHLTPEQDTFLDGLTLTGSPPLTSADVNQLIGVDNSLTVQDQIDGKISRSGDVMGNSANLTFDGGEVLGLPANPLDLTAAASKAYVDSIATSGIGDGYLAAVDWTTSSQPLVPGNALAFTIKQLNNPDEVFFAYGISRDDHVHQAIDITVDTNFNSSYPVDVQGTIEYIETNKADIVDPIFPNNITVTNLLKGSEAFFTGTVIGSEPFASDHLTTKNYVDSLLITPPEISVTRTIESLATDLSPPALYRVQAHSVADNLLSITINGMKQYPNSTGFQVIEFSSTISEVSIADFTGLDPTIIYDFSITVDGGTPVIITIPIGALTLTHGDLISTINSQFIGNVPPVGAVYDLPYSFNVVSLFTSSLAGVGSSISITDPLTSNQYLFAIDPSPIAITNVVFNNLATGSPPVTPTGSPLIPDEIIILGDSTPEFVVGKTFTILGSTYDGEQSYDSTYSVHENASSFDGTSTTVPLGRTEDPSIIQPINSGSTTPIITTFGNVNFTPLGGFVSVSVAISGIAGDYIETDLTGVLLSTGEGTTHVLFSETIPSLSTIETILLS